MKIAFVALMMIVGTGVFAEPKPDIVLRQMKVKYSVSRNWARKTDGGQYEFKRATVCEGETFIPVTQLQEQHSVPTSAFPSKAAIRCVTDGPDQTDTRPLYIFLDWSMYVFPKDIGDGQAGKTFMTYMGFTDLGPAQVANVSGTLNLNLKNFSSTLHLGAGNQEDLESSPDVFDAFITAEDAGASDADGIIAK